MAYETIDNEKYLEYLLNNAFDFLKRSIGQFENEPKYSVINFCSAIELFLKARLLKEHWSLVISQKKEPNLKNFKDGNFYSEDFKCLIKKINNIFDGDVNQKIESCFNKLSDDRNKMIHFYHSINVPESKEKEIKNLVAKQSEAWNHLMKLFEKWDDIFLPYNEIINDLDMKMKSYERRNYLEKVYNDKKRELESLILYGYEIHVCEHCGFNSVKRTNLTTNLYVDECLVCSNKKNLVIIYCPNDSCEAKIEISDDEFPIEQIVCPTCGEIIDIECIKECLDTQIITKDNYDEISQINCAECCSPGSGIVHEDYYICLNCLNYSKVAAKCDWCNEKTIGYDNYDMLDSYISGCEFCDGSIGWHIDD